MYSSLIDKLGTDKVLSAICEKLDMYSELQELLPPEIPEGFTRGNRPDKQGVYVVMHRKLVTGFDYYGKSWRCNEAHEVIAYKYFNEHHTLDMPLTFGKYICTDVGRIIDRDPSYIAWCLDNVDGFTLADEHKALVMSKLGNNG